MDEKTFLRHALATVAYRGGMTLRDAPREFGAVSAAPGSRPAVRILAHIGDLFDWMLALADGEHRRSETLGDDWDAQVERFWSGENDYRAAIEIGRVGPEQSEPVHEFEGSP